MPRISLTSNGMLESNGHIPQKTLNLRFAKYYGIHSNTRQNFYPLPARC